jgi:redox-sensing transcriptional repressor
MDSESIMSLQAFRRLPEYYRFLLDLQKEQIEFIAAPAIAKAMRLNEVQVRKDLAAVSSSPGKPRVGFEVNRLIESIADYLGYSNSKDAILVGAGKLGRALLSYKGFDAHGVSIVAAFDAQENGSDKHEGGKPIFPMDKLPDLCRRIHIHIGIITVPASEAQAVCDLLVENGILAIWNFAPVHLHVPEGVLVQNENMATQLAVLSRHLAERIHPE